MATMTGCVKEFSACKKVKSITKITDKNLVLKYKLSSNRILSGIFVCLKKKKICFSLLKIEIHFGQCHSQVIELSCAFEYCSDRLLKLKRFWLLLLQTTVS